MLVLTLRAVGVDSLPISIVVKDSLKVYPQQDSGLARGIKIERK